MNAALVLVALSRICSQFASNLVSLTLIRISHYGLILSAYESHRKFGAKVSFEGAEIHGEHTELERKYEIMRKNEKGTPCQNVHQHTENCKVDGD